MSARILVAIVTYNSAEVIGQCLRHLAWLGEAAGIEAEIVVADNASRDDTVPIVQDLVKERPELLTLVPSKVNVGWGAGNNAAISATKLDPDYVLLCNPDAHIDEENFRMLLRALQEHEPRAAMAVPLLEGGHGAVLGANPEWSVAKYFFGGYTSGRRGYRRFQDKYLGRRDSFEIERGYASGALVLVAFPALREAGFFDERIFMFNDDIDLTRRLRSAGRCLVGVGSAVGHHTGGRGSRLVDEAEPGTSTSSLYYDSEIVFVEKWYGRRWARWVAAYRWHIFFSLNNTMRRLAGRRPLDVEPLRAPSGAYLGKRPPRPA